MPRTRPAAAPPEDPRTVRLLGVLLVDALETLGRGPRAEGSREARAWICARDDGDARYSFAGACAAYGLPAVALRRRVGLRPQAPPRRSARGWLRRPSR